MGGFGRFLPGIVCLFLFALPAAAQFPSKPLRLIVGFPPGGAADVTIRIIAQGLSAQLGQPVVVENRPGAESVIAAEAVMKSAPDGYSLFMGTNTAMVAVPSRANPPDDPFRDFTPISSLGRFTVFLVVSPKVPAKSVAEFLEQVRANPGKLNYASSNSAALLAAVLQARSPLLPEVPTGAEVNVQGISIVPWAAIFGPAKMPADLTALLNKEINTVLARPDTREQFDRQGFEPGGSSSQELAAFHKTQWDSWTRTVREQGLKFD